MPVAERERPVAGPVEPALIAELLYLQPAERGPLLQVLAGLGVFVRETASPRVEDAFRPGLPHPDFVVLSGECQPDEARLVRFLALDLGIPVVAIATAAEEADAFLRAGATAAVAQGEPSSVFRDAVRAGAEAARDARAVAAARGRGGGRLLFGGVTMRTSPAALVLGTASVRISPTEYRVLDCLMRHQGQVVTHQALEEQIGGPGAPVSTGYLKSVIGRIRRKVRWLGGDPSCLSAIRGTGYRLEW
jgi:two-component system KDP operon response regulator KdpE